MNLKLIFVGVAGAALSLPSMAQVFTTTGWGGGEGNGNTVGVAFTPTANATLTDMGAFHYQGYTAATVTLTLWEQGVPTALESISFSLNNTTAAAPLVSGQPFNYVFANRDLSLGFIPVSLTAGHEYAVTLSATGAYNRNSGGSFTENAAGITLNGTLNSGSILSGNPFGTGFASYSGGLGTVNFIIGPSAVPEPSAYAAIAGLGLVGFAAYRKFRR